MAGSGSCSSPSRSSTSAIEDPDEQTKLKSMTIIGYKATDQLVNSDYDENERSLTSFNKWRGIGDISSTGKWIFRDGDFALVHYEVDPTENGEIDGQPVLDFESAPVDFQPGWRLSVPASADMPESACPVDSRKLTDLLAAR